MLVSSFKLHGTKPTCFEVCTFRKKDNLHKIKVVFILRYRNRGYGNVIVTVKIVVLRN